MENVCLQCGKGFITARSDAKYCSAVCRKASSRKSDVTDKGVTLKSVPDVTDKSALPDKVYLNDPMPLGDNPVHGQLHTVEGDEIQLEKGILRVRRRWEDPALAKAKKAEELAVVERKAEQGTKPIARRRGA